MDYAVIALTAIIVSGLTLFSGFGLGTLLMPAFALFIPLPAAIAATAIVHLANNLFKLGLLGKAAEWRVAWRFGLPAAFAAVFGAGALVLFSELPVLARYELSGRAFEVVPIKLVIGVLIVCFAILELSTRFQQLSIPSKYLIPGGLLSGFFGGLSGNQGALRSAFLIKSGLDKEAFVATGVVSAVMVDTVRLTVYGLSFVTVGFAAVSAHVTGLMVTAAIAAFTGAFLGRRLLHKVTMTFVRFVVAASMIAIGSGLAIGLI